MTPPLDDPTLNPPPREDDVLIEDSIPAQRTSSAGTELALVAVPIEPSVRKLMAKTDNAMRNAQTAFDLHYKKRPEVAVRFQGNQVKMLELQLKLLQFNAELHGRGSGVDTGNKDGKGNSSSTTNMQFNFGDDNARDIIGKLLSGQRVVDVPPRGTPVKSSSGDGG